MSMQVPKYAKLENERRFLVFSCPDLSGAPSRLIEDIYFNDSRLRLRTITHIDGAREFKLCKKYETLDPTSGPVVNIYLSAGEHAILSRLQGRPLRKRRYRIAWRTRSYGVDVFEDELAGLVLCEAEAESADAIRVLEFPPWASRDVTADRFYTGGNLARVTAAELTARLNSE
jgi:CYTH domain-containing protein